jgi:hypothetical protein
MKKIILLNVFIFLLVIILLLIIPTFFPDVSHISPFHKEIDNSTLIIDSSISYQTINETRVYTTYDFFIPESMNQFPQAINDWVIQNISFNNAVYNFYSPGEISGKRVTDRNGTYIDVLVIQGPKVYWHNPEDCFLFSNWNIDNRTVSRFPLNEMSDSDSAEGKIPENEINVSLGDFRYNLDYFYIFKDRSDFSNVSLMSIMTPADQDKVRSFYLKQAVLQEIFSRGGSGKSASLSGRQNDIIPVPYGENNPPAIQNWLVLGPFESASGDISTYPPSDWEQNWLGASYGKILPEVGQVQAGKQWRVVNGSYGIIELDSIYKPANLTSAYAALYIQSPETQSLFLNVVSDDGVRVWLNGNPVHSRIRLGMGDQNINGITNHRGSSLEDTIPVTLHKGWNILLVELYQWKGSWKYYAQFRRTDNTLPDDLIYSIQRPSYSRPGGQKIFQIGYEDDSAAEFSSEWDVDKDYIIGEGFKEFKRAVSKESPETNIHFQLSSGDAGSPHALSVGVKKIAESSVGYIIVNIYMNNQFVGTYSYPEDWLTKRIVIPSILFREGDNTLTFEWIKGEPYIVWDYIYLE